MPHEMEVSPLYATLIKIRSLQLALQAHRAIAKPKRKHVVLVTDAVVTIVHLFGAFFVPRPAPLWTCPSR